MKTSLFGIIVIGTLAVIIGTSQGQVARKTDNIIE